ncbi:MAG TPA: TIGR03435 family protein [Bryobacteraceae bacterium]
MAAPTKTVLLTLLASLALAQTPPTAPAFEIASVKSSVPGTLGGRIQFLPGGRFRATNAPFKYLLQEVYQIRDFQIVGDRRWMSIIADGYNARYDIEANASDSTTEIQLREMVKALLADRFQLALHMETRELPVYALAPAKGGIKLRQSSASNAPSGRGGIAFMVRGWIQGTNVAMPALVRALSELVDRPVVDRTNFTESFDFKLTFTPEDAGRDPNTPWEGACPPGFAAFREQRGLKPEPESCPSIFTAVQEQLGLRLNPQRDPIEAWSSTTSNAHRPINRPPRTDPIVSGVHSAPHSRCGAKFQPLLKGGRYSQNVEAIRGIRVILAAFIDHAKIAVLSRFGVGHQAVEFPDFERSRIAPVVGADAELPRTCRSFFHVNPAAEA